MTEIILNKVLNEQFQTHETRMNILKKLEKEFDKPVISLFTSFNFPVMLENNDADTLEGVLQSVDLRKGLVLIISSPGGDGLAAERIINICRSYSGTGKYWVIIPGKAKSAATMVCFGAGKIFMGPSSELGPIDPQITIAEDGRLKRFSLYNIVKSYRELFEKTVKAKGNLQPYLQQLANYDSREIKEFEAAIALSEDIAIKALSTGMMNGKKRNEIKKSISMFLKPKKTKTHGRPIYRDEASGCGLEIEKMNLSDRKWRLIYELYVRSNNFVSTKASKCIENSENSFLTNIPNISHDEKG